MEKIKNILSMLGGYILANKYVLAGVSSLVSGVVGYYIGKLVN